MGTESERLVRWIALATGAALAVGLGGLIARADLSRPPAPVTVEGIVVDEADAPLDHISAQVYRWENDQWTAITATETDAAGRYRFPGLRAGRLTVAFEDDSGVGYLECWYGGSAATNAAKSVRLAPGQTGVLDQRLVLGGSITGRVTYDNPSLGVVGASLFSVVASRLLHGASGGATGFDQLHSISSLDPTSDGRWRIQYLPTGSYILQVLDNDEDAAPGAAIASQWIGAGPGLTDWRRATVFTVRDGHTYRAAATAVGFESSPMPPSVVLTVSGVGGAPVRGATVRFRLTGSPLEYSFLSGRGESSGRGVSPFTDARGQLDLFRVIPGRYTVTVTARGYQPLTEKYRFSPEAPGDILKLAIALAPG